MSKNFENKTSAKPWFRKLLSGFSLRRPRFYSKPVHVVFVTTLKVFSEFYVHGFVHHSTDRTEITNKMRPCSRIYYSNVS
jgi:hypothetical protein